jgi:signal transduction histidine kinase
MMELALHRALPVLGFALNLLLVVVTLIADRRDPRHRTFAAFSAALAAWNLGVIGLRSATGPASALRWEWVIHVAIALVPALFVEYVRAFLGAPARGRARAAAFGLAAAFIVLTPTRWLIPDVQPTGWGYAPVPGPAYVPFLAYFYGYLVGGAAMLALATRRLRGALITRARWIVAGILVALAGGAADFLRFVVGWERLYPIGVPANMVFGLALGVAIVRYRLVDVTVLVRRAVLYALASLALAPFAVIAMLAFARGGRGDGVGSPVAALIAVGALAAGLPLLRVLETRLERVMFHRQHGVRDALLALARQLNEVTDVQGVARVLTRGLVTVVPVRSAGLYLPDPVDHKFRGIERYGAPDDDVPALPETVDDLLVERLAARRETFVAEDETLHAGGQAAPIAASLSAARVALAVPVIEDDALSAVVLIGQRRSGAAFGRDEIELLSAVAANAAIALRNARLYDDLRRRIEDVQAAHAQLAQSAKLAAIGELAAGVVHEVNNPLMVVMGHTGRLRRELPATPAAQARLDVIEQETERAARILRRVLDFARRREPALKPVDIREVLERALALVSPRLSHADIVTDAEIFGNVAPVLGDRDELTQVFVNLFNNALDAMPEGGTLRVRTEVRSADGIPCLTVSVADTGIGIGADELKHVFQPFYTTKPDGRGTGLGLSVSQGIVRRHEGTLEVTSEPGKGSTFMVSLRLAS